MRTFLIAAALILVSSVAPAWADDNPACAKFENPLEYNACLASWDRGRARRSPSPNRPAPCA